MQAVGGEVARGKPAEIGVTFLHHLQDLRVRAFDDVHRQFRVFVLHRRQDLHQAVVRQGMGGGDAKLGEGGDVVVLAEVEDVFHRSHDAFDIGHDRLADFGQADKGFAVAPENWQTEQFFGELDVFAHRRLRHMQFFRRCGHVVTGAGHRRDALQLF